jgi:NB-ARC domain
LPRVRLPDNFVPRPQALDSVKAKLLGAEDKTLVVSAIAGLGGLGKSVLATALVLDREVQARFADGILWVTLGQNPDLLSLLGDWIRELDKSREAFSANTLEAAARYLGTLLAERRMLLVVDDVWNAAHAEWFRVGGDGCQVLVTTREARLEGAEYYDLDLMTEAEAIELVRKKLGQGWQQEQEAEVRAFANLLGRLPLALDLAANQVRDGLTWEELRSEFEAERRSVFLGTGRRSSALQLLDSSEAWERLGEEEQRKYSLQACFNLSLKRLNPQQFEQFAWLGVLPEDVNLDRRVAAVLWDLSPLRAQKVLIDLRNRSFLTGGVDTIPSGTAEPNEGEPSYRVHDLMHDLARISIDCPPSNESNQLGGLGMSVAAAHQGFLERYRAQAEDRRWDKLPSDGYIHRRLTWHMIQAGWLDEIHALMAMSDERGNNAWFEACDRIGQPAIFVEDVSRAWELAEQMYESEPTRSIGLQCRYALITATLNSLVSNLPIGMMAEFVKKGFWMVEQAWAYIEQMQEEENVAEAIQALAPYLSKSLFAIAVNKVRGFEYVYRQVQTLKSLAVIGREYFSALLTAACEIQGEYNRADVLSRLAEIERKYLPEALDAARQIQDEYNRAKILSRLAEIEQEYLPEALDAALQIQEKSNQAKVFKSLAAIDREYLPELLTIACNITKQNDLVLTNISSGLSAIDWEYFPKILTAARKIQDKYNRAKILTNLAEIERKYLPEALDTARQIQDEYNRAEVLTNLAAIEREYFPEALAAACQIQYEYNRGKVLTNLAAIEREYFPEALSAARQIKDEYNRAKVLANLAAIERKYLPEALTATRQIQSEKEQAEVLSSLAAIDRKYFLEALAAACQIRDEYNRAEILSNLAAIDRKYFPEILTAVYQIRYDYYWAIVWSNLAAIDREYFPKVLTVARQIEDKYNRADILSRLAAIDRKYFPEALTAARQIRQIQHEHERAKVLSSLAAMDRAYLPEALTAARQIQHEASRINALISLVAIDGAYFSEALTAAREIQSEDYRAGVLSSLAKHAPEDCLIQIWESIEEIARKPTQAVALSGYSSRLPLTRLSHPDWCKYLHILAHRKRSELMEDLAQLYPAILHLGGVPAMRGVVDAINEVCSQWR